MADDSADPALKAAATTPLRPWLEIIKLEHLEAEMANIARCTSVESLELHRATLLAKVQNPFEAPTAHRVLMGRDGDSCPDDAVIGSAMALQRMDWHDPPIPSLPPLSLSPAHPFLLVAFAGFARRSLSHSSPILCIASPGVTLGRSQLALPVDTRELLEMALDGRVKVCQHHSLRFFFLLLA